MGAMKALCEVGQHVPNEVSIVEFEDLMAEHMMLVDAARAFLHASRQQAS